MAGTYKFIRDIQTSLHKGLHVIQVDIPYPKPAQAQLYEQFYGCSVRFAASKGRFWMYNVHFQSHLPSGDPTAKALYRQQCDQLLQKQKQKQKQEQTSSNLAEQVRAHLTLFTEDFPAVAEVSAILGLPERTLRHELRRLGTSFRRILDDLRFNRARQLLENSQLPGATQALGATAYEGVRVSGAAYAGKDNIDSFGVCA